MDACMNKLNNIEVFALCVAEIMEELYTAFPIPVALQKIRVPYSYGTSVQESTPRTVQPDDPEYQTLFNYGFHTSAAPSDVAADLFPQHYLAKYGQPLKYWTNKQRLAIQDGRDRVREAERIHNSTVRFLVNEGYIKDTSPSNEKPPSRPLLVLTSKGFAHLHKKFENGTIRDEFHSVKNLFDKIKTGAEVVSTAQQVGGLVQTLASFFS